MSVVQYIRKASLIIGQDAGKAMDLSELRFRFSVTRGDIQTPNEANVRIYNIKEDTITSLQSMEFTRLVLQAGYGGNYGIIFDGQIKQTRRGRENQVDTYLDVTAADGDSMYNFSVSAFSLAAGSNSPKNVIEEMLKGMAEYSVSKGYVPDNLAGDSKVRGSVCFGMTRDELRKIAKDTNTSWSIQDGKLNMIPITAYKPGDIPVITAETGMIGLPEQAQNGIHLKTLLNPNIKIGQLVKLDNASIQKYKYDLSLGASARNLMTEQVLKTNADGYYYVMIAEHHGDTRGNDWYTDLTCLSADATIPQDYLPRTGIYGDVGTIKRYG